MQPSEEFEKIVQAHHAAISQADNTSSMSLDMLEYRYPLFCEVCGRETMHRVLPDMGNKERYQCQCRAIKHFTVR